MEKITIFIDTETISEQELLEANLIETDSANTVKSYREKLADKFISSLTEGRADWRIAWGAEKKAPKAANGKSFQGVNRFLLGYQQEQCGYHMPVWYTQKQAEAAGGSIAEGQKPVQLEYFLPYDSEQNAAISWKAYYSSTNRENMQLKAQYISVYNIEQLSGIEAASESRVHQKSLQEAAETIVANTGISVINDGGRTASYRLENDSIHLPKKECFQNSESYQAALMEQLAYASGHTARLCRCVDGGFDHQGYPSELLVCDMTSMLLSTEFAYQMPVRDQRSKAVHNRILSEWGTKLAAEPEKLIELFRDAQRTYDYLLWQGEIYTQKEYQRASEKSIRVSKSKIFNYEYDKSIYQEPEQKLYVKDFIYQFLEQYDFEHPARVPGKLLPSLILSKELSQGGMSESLEECRDWIQMDPEAAENTQLYIYEKYPELSGLTAESDPKRFSILMMEREIYKMISAADEVDENWDKPFSFDKKAAQQICRENQIKMPVCIRGEAQRYMTGFELE